MQYNSKKVVIGGILGALCIVCLYFATTLPTSRLFLYGLSSFFCSIMLIEAGARWAWVFFGATSLLAVFILPNKAGIIPYVLFFGIYGIVKYYLEGIKSKVISMAAKGVYFLVTALIAVTAVKELFIAEINSIIPIWGLVLIAVVVFYIYDYAYSSFIIYYERSIKKRIF